MNIINTIRKLFILILSFLISAGIIPAPQPPADGIDVTLDYKYADSDAGCAAGTLTLESNFDSDYQMYWGDSANEKLTVTIQSGKTLSYSKFAEVTTSRGSGSVTLNEFSAIPENAQNILVYHDKEMLASYAVPYNKQTVSEIPVYEFGALSDVHFNRYTSTGTDITEQAFPRALDFFKDNGVSFVGVCGDLSSRGENSAYERFNAISSNYNFPVYSCKGNHDCYEKFDFNAWSANMNPGVFGDETADGILARSDNGYDFVYTLNGDIFIFLSQISSTYAPYVQILTDDQLSWLTQQLQKYSDKRVYLFFHTFLNAPDLPYAMGEGNLINDYGISYSLPYFKGNRDEVYFAKLLKKYKNVIFFNGHSHWAYEMQSYNPRLNITDYDGTTAAMVHVSSVAAPRTSDIKSPSIVSNPGTMSEGLLIKVYNGHIIVSGVDFINSQLLAYAYYNINTK